MAARISGAVAVALAVIGIIFSLVGIGLVWWGRSTADQAVDTVAADVTTRLARVDDALQQVQTSITTVQERIATFQDDARSRISAASANGGDRLVSALDTTVGDEIARLSERSAALRERIDALNTMISTADRLMPGRDLPQLPVERLQRIDEGIAKLNQSMIDLRERLQTEGIPVPDLLLRLGEGVTRINQALGTMTTAIDGVQAELNRITTAVQEAQSTSHTALTLIAVLLTLLCLYSVFLHAVLFLQGRMWGRSSTSIDQPQATSISPNEVPNAEQPI